MRDVVAGQDVAAGSPRATPEAVEQATRELERAKDLQAQRMTRDHQLQHGAVEPVEAAEE